MDVFDFFNESIRMCSTYQCDECTAGKCIWCIRDPLYLSNDKETLKEYISIVEKWSKEDAHGSKINS